MVANFIQGTALHYFRAHFCQKALVGVGVFFEEVFRHDGAENGISQILQPLVILYSIGFVGGVGFVRKGEFENRKVGRREAYQWSEFMGKLFLVAIKPVVET